MQRLSFIYLLEAVVAVHNLLLCWDAALPGWADGCPVERWMCRPGAVSPAARADKAVPSHAAWLKQPFLKWGKISNGLDLASHVPLETRCLA